MKAILLADKHQPVQLIDAPKPTAGPDDVLIKLKAAALNHRDLFIQEGLYPKIKLPVILGSDGSGIVEEVGAGVDPSWLGEPVLINPGMNWGDNPEYDGPDFHILGMPQNGTFAEYVAIDVRYVHRKPDHLSFEQAAALPLTGLTAWRALMTRAGLQINAGKSSEKVLITGIGGGAALLALQLAVAIGAEVWVTSGDDEKIEKAKALGAAGGVNYRSVDWHKTLLTKIGADKRGYFNVTIDSAAGPDFAKLIDIAAPGGRIAFYGGTTGNITDVVPAKVFFKQLAIFGSTTGNEREFTDMISFVTDKQIIPVIDEVFPLFQADQAMQKMKRGKQFGKIILRTNH
ncbi:zinc-binding dehydrogenase [Spirosoma sp.]|uniref:zinc-binding dehydrogenase n=1 Tax=Spirosoma sp. TaxID=1899569 RepID=UPI003B3A3C2B